MHSQRRKSARRRALQPAKVLLAGGPVDCLVNDLSEDGAKLQFRTSQAGLPGHFKLMLAGEVLPRTCKLCWTTGLHVGVEFAGGRNALLNTSALEERLTRLRTGRAAP